MSDSTSRKLALLVAGLLVLGIWIKAHEQRKAQIAGSSSATASVNVFSADPAALAGIKAATIPAEKCSLTVTNGGTYALATPTACAGVTIAAVKLNVSEKPCGESKASDFRAVTSSTYYKGDFGFYLGEANPRRCLVVKEILGAI